MTCLIIDWKETPYYGLDVSIATNIWDYEMIRKIIGDYQVIVWHNPDDDDKTKRLIKRSLNSGSRVIIQGLSPEAEILFREKLPEAEYITRIDDLIARLKPEFGQ